MPLQETPDANVAFTIVIKRDGSEKADLPPDDEDTLVNVTHEAVTGAVQEVQSDTHTENTLQENLSRRSA